MDTTLSILPNTVLIPILHGLLADSAFECSNAALVAKLVVFQILYGRQW